MQPNLDFRRFDRGHHDQVKGFHYTSVTDKDFRDAAMELRALSMDRLGFNQHVHVSNYTSQTIYLGGSLRTTPTAIMSLISDGVRPYDSDVNHIVVRIYETEIGQNFDPKKRVSRATKTEIRIPGRMLNQGSVFVDELDCYLMTEAQIIATREMIAQDVTNRQWDSITIPVSMDRSDPEITYGDFRQLTKECLDRADKIQIRIGIDLRYDAIPAILKSMRICIYDSYFSPFSCHKLVYDPTLDPDSFVIENIYISSTDAFSSTLSELAQHKALYIDHNERETLFGSYYGMVMFADAAPHIDYVHRRKSLERFNDEELYLAHRSGNPLLKEEIAKLNRVNADLVTEAHERSEEIKALRETGRRLRSDLKDREEQIRKISEHYDAKMSSDHVMGGLLHESHKLSLEERKLHHEQDDLHRKEKAAPLQHKATLLKAIADLVKSGWGIVTGCVGAVLAIVAICKKYGVTVSMAS